jgi:hypothetical protein
MCAVVATAPLSNTYKGGTISQTFGDLFSWGMKGIPPGMQVSDIPKRKFVAGETLWITGYVVQKDGVDLQFYSDPFNNVRYYGQLKIMYPKGTVPAPDDVLKTIAEVATLQPPDNAAQEAPSQQPAANSVAAPPPAPMADIPPPPPPVDAPAAPPKTISLGQTKNQVAAIFGQPTKIVKLGTKEIDYYPDMKVTFTNGKVTDVQ